MKTKRVAEKNHLAFFRPWTAVLLCSLVMVAGCAARPLKGGRAATAPQPGGGLDQNLAQGDNPSQPSTQTQETLRVRTYTIPAGSRLESPTLPGADAPLRRSAKAANQQTPSALGSFPSSALTLSAPMPVTEREEIRAATQLGAAQKDAARELGVRLASLRGIVWVGLGLFLFGLASIFYPPVRALIGSLTTSLTITIGGTALMVLPTLIVGNELLILGGVALLVGAWFLAHRHGQLRGLLDSSTTPPTSPSAPEPGPSTPTEQP